MNTPKLELVSFKLCPFVQRSVITLNKKKAKYGITYIDLENPPEWFNEISPLGQVPLLKVNDKTVLFESAVINEYLDETVGAPLHPSDPLQKAFERAWIEFGSSLLGLNYRATAAQDKEDLKDLLDELFTDLQRLENVVSKQGPYFRGDSFGLVDAAYAPLFMRMDLSPTLKKDPRWKEMPKTRKWADALLADSEVKSSVVPEFDQLYSDYCRDEFQSPLF
jgi:glutathione S-transferase